MKLTLQADVLNHIVGIVAKAVRSKSTGIGLENILIQVEKDKINFIGTDMEMQVTASLPFKADKTGEILLPAGSFSQYIATLDEATKVELNATDSYLVLKAEGGTARFNVLSNNDFNLIHEDKLSVFAEINPEQMLTAIKKTVFATLKGDETRPILTGVYFDSNDSKLTLAGLDTFRMSVFKFQDVQTKKDLKFVVTYRALQLLEKILRDSFLTSVLGAEKLVIKINKDASLVAFVFGDITLYVKTIEGSYPDYAAIIPVNFAVTGDVNAMEFSKALRKVGVFAQNSITKQILLKFYEDKLELSSESQENGDSKQVVTAHFSGKDMPLEIGFQYKFLFEFLNSIDADEVVIKAVDNLSPVVFAEKGNEDNYVHIIMPLKI